MSADPQSLLSERVQAIEPSGIRRMFELIASMEDPINLSIGQPHYEAPPLLAEAAQRAIRDGHNRYTVTQGVPELNALVLDRTEQLHGRRPETSLITAGVSGGLVLTFQSMLNPGDEILLPDPGFMMYRHLAAICGATVKYYSLYPDRSGERFRVDLEEVARLCTDRTKIVFVNSPSNPTGGVLSRDEIKGLSELANERGLYVVSDEIYDFFTYLDDYSSPVSYADRCIQLGGWSKTYAVPGWRLGWATGPAEVLDAMKTLQQFSFVCAPAPFQRALVEAMPELDMTPYRDEYIGKRNRLTEKLHPAYHLRAPDGSFYAFPELPLRNGATSADFLQAAIDRKLLVVLGNTFSQRDTHFRLSFAADDETLDRGVAVLNELAEHFA
ncbi:MAG: pyridoxal phosphate-dependent aminotransferase [bacterium]|nr:pyridoxal phosphate-dependent aminotransferase [bacterium]